MEFSVVSKKQMLSSIKIIIFSQIKILWKVFSTSFSNVTVILQLKHLKKPLTRLLKKTCLFKKRYVRAKQAFFINQKINKEFMKKPRLRNKVQNSKLKNDVNWKKEICMKCETSVVIEEVILNFDIADTFNNFFFVNIVLNVWFSLKSNSKIQISPRYKTDKVSRTI